MKGKFSKAIISTVIILNILFAAAVLYVFLKTSAEPAALVTAWFGWTTGELWMLASIKKKKVERGKDIE
jgi:hypothetical protein